MCPRMTLSLTRFGGCQLPSRRAYKGKNTVKFRILRDANIQKDSLKMIASSQKSELDTTSLGAVRETAPFGHLPENFSEPFIVLRMTFYYNLLPLMEPKKFQ
jgi:outer membrane biosynthesis protein TonB